MIHFFTFKWGKKYGPEYVNALYRSLQVNVNEYFDLTCITDDTNGLRKEIQVIDYNTFDPFDYPKNKIFTREKLVLFERFQTGRNVWLDLDILIHDNITKEVTSDCPRAKFIWNHWNPLSRSYDWYGKGASCHVNSSFVMWEGTGGKHLFNYLINNEEKSFFTYRSLDKFLFYQCHRKGMMDFWDKGFISNYNREGFQKNGKVSIFNTSHLLYNKGLNEVAFELDETTGWSKEIWTGYLET